MKLECEFEKDLALTQTTLTDPRLHSPSTHARVGKAFRDWAAAGTHSILGIPRSTGNVA